VSADLTKALGAAVSLTGGLDSTTASKIKSAVDALNRTLGRPYDRAKKTLVSSTPDRDQIDEIIKQRVPPDYANKAYKRLFWRSVYRVVPFLRNKRKTEDEINQISLLALTTFALIFELIVTYCNQILRQSQGSAAAAEDPQQGDPDDFDPELDEATKALENAIQPSEGKNQHQKQTQKTVERKLQKASPTQAVKTEEEFRDFLGKQSRVLDGCRSAISRRESDLTEMLRYSSDASFQAIHASSIKAAQLGQALLSASTEARSDLQPGSYLALTGMVKTISTLNNIIIQSVALNRKQRSEINKRLKSMKDQATSPRSTPAEEED